MEELLELIQIVLEIAVKENMDLKQQVVLFGDLNNKCM